jgi:hypothetical protein
MDVVRLHGCNCLSLHLCNLASYTTGPLLYVMMEVTCDRWCALVLPRITCTPSRGPAPPLPPLHSLVSIKQQLATQNTLVRRLVENEEHRGVDRPHHNHHQDMDSSYSDFLVTHPPLFSKPIDPLEADNWLHTTKSKFGLLHYTEYQKTLYVA